MRIKRIWSDYEINFLKENYENKGIIYCSDILNISKSKIKFRARKLGLKMSRASRGFKTHINLQQFINISNPKVAYLLGYLWADGYITKGKVILCLAKPDADSLKPLLNNLGTWYYADSKIKRATHLMTQSCMFDKDFTNFLLNLNFKEKSLVSPKDLLRLIPKYLQHYFWRGYLDGDGCFTYSPGQIKKSKFFIQFAGSFNQDWTFLKNFCEFNQMKYSISKQSYINKKSLKLNSCSKFNINNKQNMYNFLKYVYNGNLETIGLKRKINKWLFLKKHIETTLNIGHFKKINLEEDIRPFHVAS